MEDPGIQTSFFKYRHYISSYLHIVPFCDLIASWNILTQTSLSHPHPKKLSVTVTRRSSWSWAPRQHRQLLVRLDVKSCRWHEPEKASHYTQHPGESVKNEEKLCFESQGVWEFESWWLVESVYPTRSTYYIHLPLRIEYLGMNLFWW